jgi:formyltetrahydrofolate hydrolase
VRYADDMVFILKPEDDEKEILTKVETFLSEHGMNIKKTKTKMTTTQNGFDFLGWNFKVHSNNKFRSVPSNNNYRNVTTKLNEIIKNSTYGADEKSKLLAPIVRGWRNYHKHCDMKKHNLWDISHRLWKKFIKQPRMNRKKASDFTNKAFPKISYSVNRFI